MLSRFFKVTLLLLMFNLSVHSQPFDFKAKPVDETMTFVWNGEKKVLKKGSRVIEPGEWVRFQKQTLALLKTLELEKIGRRKAEDDVLILKTERELMQEYDRKFQEANNREIAALNKIIDISQKEKRQLRRRIGNMRMRMWLERAVALGLVVIAH